MTVRRLQRILEILLFIYPPSFRREYGRDLIDTHLDRFRHGSREDAACTDFLLALVDMAWGVVPEWCEVCWRRLDCRQPMKSGVRSLFRRPGLTAVVVVTIGLGVGANTAVFSLVDAVLLNPLAVASPEALVAVYDASNPQAPTNGFPYPTFQEIADASRSLARVAAFDDLEVALNTGGPPAIVTVALVTGNYFSVLGVEAQLGRCIQPFDAETPGQQPVAVLSDQLWTTRFNRNTEIVGQSIRLGPTLFTIIGIAPAGFRGTVLTRSPEIWVPVTMVPALGTGGIWGFDNLFTTFRGLGWLQLVGRLSPGYSRGAAAEELTRLLASTRADREFAAGPAPMSFRWPMPRRSSSGKT